MRLKHSNLVVAALLIGAMLAIAGILRGADPPEPGQAHLWAASIAAYGAAQGADVASSWGRPELNPIVRNGAGRFGARGMGIKAVITGGIILWEWLILRKHPSLGRSLAFVNFGLAAGTGAVAWRNWEVRR